MEGTLTAGIDPLDPEQARAKAAILAECDKFAQAGITFLAVHFDGAGDSGVTEEVKCFNSDYYSYEEHEPAEYDASYLLEQFETLVPFGYENDCGGFGDVILDVAARKLTVERNDRFEDYTTSSYEVCSHGAPTATCTKQCQEIRRNS
jgi:hypothetical protein